MSFKDIDIYSSGRPWNHLCNCGRGQYEEHICEIILNLCRVVQEILVLYDQGLQYLLYRGSYKSADVLLGLS